MFTIFQSGKEESIALQCDNSPATRGKTFLRCNKEAEYYFFINSHSCCLSGDYCCLSMHAMKRHRCCLFNVVFFPFGMSHIAKTEVTLPGELLGFVCHLQSLIFAQKEVLLLKDSPRRTLPNGNS